MKARSVLFVACTLLILSLLPVAGAQDLPSVPDLGGEPPAPPDAPPEDPVPDLTGGGAGEAPESPTPAPLPADEGFDPVGMLGETSFVVGLGLGLAGAAMVGWLAFHGGAKFVTAENVLDNDTRYSIYQYLREHPGTHLRQMASTLSLSTTNALWHLRKLEDANLIKGKKVDGYKVFYPVEEGIEGKRKALANAALKKDNAKGILDHVAHNPGTHQRQLARALQVNHGTVRWHLKKMVSAGLLIQMKREHATLYYLTELGTNMVATAPEGPAAPEWATGGGPGDGFAEA